MRLGEHPVSELSDFPSIYRVTNGSAPDLSSSVRFQTASVSENQCDAGVGDTIDVVTDDQSPAGGSSIRLHHFASGCLDVHDAVGTGRIRPTHAGQVGGQIDRRSAIGGGESNHHYSGCST